MNVKMKATEYTNLLKNCMLLFQSLEPIETSWFDDIFFEKLYDLIKCNDRYKKSADHYNAVVLQRDRGEPVDEIGMHKQDIMLIIEEINNVFTDEIITAYFYELTTNNICEEKWVRYKYKNIDITNIINI